MSIDPAIFRALVAQGATPEMLLAVVEADAAVQEEKLARKRADTAARVRKHRNKPGNARNALHDVTDVTPSPNDIYSNPLPTPLETSNDVSPPAGLEIERVGEPPLTADEILEAWNATADRCGLPKAKLTPQRRRKLAPLIRNHGLDDFTEAIRALERSPFLRGENDRAWRANFDFFIQPSSFQKLIEGSYDRQAH